MGLSESKVESIIRSIHLNRPPHFLLEVIPKCNVNQNSASQTTPPTSNSAGASTTTTRAAATSASLEAGRDRASPAQHARCTCNQLDNNQQKLDQMPPTLTGNLDGLAAGQASPSSCKTTNIPPTSASSPASHTSKTRSSCTSSTTSSTSSSASSSPSSSSSSSSSSTSTTTTAHCSQNLKTTASVANLSTRPSTPQRPPSASSPSSSSPPPLLAGASHINDTHQCPHVTSTVATTTISTTTPNSLQDSISCIKSGLKDKKLIEEFDKLSRRCEDEPHIESRLIENMDKNRYQDILPYDSTRVQLIDSMTGDYINASFVNMTVPYNVVNRYIATQGPLASTCEDFWQMIWEQNCSLIIMVTPLIETGRIKCHKYWPEEKASVRHGQLLIQNLHEKSKTATINRTIQMIDIKSGEKRLTTQIQYRAWPDHEVPTDCSDFLKLVDSVRKHRVSKLRYPVVVHCSAGIGRTGVLILMETAICIMESGQPINPIKILEEMRKQRAMLIQTSGQFEFVAQAICKVYDQKLYKRSLKRRKKFKTWASSDNHD